MSEKVRISKIDRPTEDEKELQSERIEVIKKVMTPELRAQYIEIASLIRTSAAKRNGDVIRGCVDVESGEIEFLISDWIEKVKKHIQENSIEDVDLEDIEPELWLYFLALGRTINTHNIDESIEEFKDGIDKISPSDQEREIKKFKKNLADRFSASPLEIEGLYNIGNGSDYTIAELVEVVAELWKEYDVAHDKVQLGKIAIGNMLAKVAEGFAPYLYKDIILDNKINVAVFIENFFLRKGAGLLNMYVSSLEEQYSFEVENRINERVVNYIFYNEFEMAQEQSFGRVIQVVNDARNATKELINAPLGQIAPIFTGIATSLVFLTSLHPILGIIGASSLPASYLIAKRKGRLWNAYYGQNQDISSAIFTKLQAVKEGFEDIITSPARRQIVEDTKDLYRQQAKIELDQSSDRRKMDFRSELPEDITDFFSVIVGVVLQQMGLITGGAILSNIQYSSQLRSPVERIFSLVHNRFGEYLEAIRRLDRMFGPYENLDFPEGEKEERRVPVSSLANCSIRIDGLSYKNILREVSLEISEGEFVAISGETGTGKTTLLRNMVGLYHGDKGEITLGGVPLDKIKRYGPDSIFSAVSYASQNTKIFPDMTLRENIKIWAGDVQNDLVPKVLETLNLEHLIPSLDQPAPAYLSGGERARIGLARSLLKKPKVMILDEPTAGLDPDKTIPQIIDIIGRIRQTYPSMTIIAVSHDTRIREAADREIKLAEINKSRR